MKPMRALLVDDEPMALRRLTIALDRFEAVEIVESTTSARRALELIGTLAPDVVFLDVSMPGLDGFEVVASLPAADRPAIVFVTAYSTHAVRAFGIDAVDYLLKPVTPERLAEAVERARRATSSKQPARDDAQLSDADHLWAQRARKHVRIPVSTISRFEAERDYVRVHAESGGGLMRTTLTAVAARLDPAVFIRLHRSAIGRRSAIVAVRRASTGALKAVFADGGEAPVGRSYAAGLRALRQSIGGPAM